MLSLLLMLIAFFCATPAHAQTGNTVTVLFPGVPTGTCAFVMLAIDTGSGKEYNCPSGTWVAIGGGGGGTCPAGTTGYVQLTNGTDCVSAQSTESVIGPPESTLPSGIQGYTGTGQLSLYALGAGNGIAVEAAQATSEQTLAIAAASYGKSSTAIEGDALSSDTAGTGSSFGLIGIARPATGITVNTNTLSGLSALARASNRTVTNLIGGQYQVNTETGTITYAAAIQAVAALGTNHPTTLVGVDVGNVTLGTTNYALRTASGGVQLGTLAGGGTTFVCTDNSGNISTSGCLGTSSVTQTFSTSNSVTITHNFGTAYYIVQCRDASGTPLYIGPDSIAYGTNSASIGFTGTPSGSCTAVLGGIGGVGGGSSAGGVNVVAFSATPTFDLSLGWLQKITLTGNVTSSTVSSPTGGVDYTLEICQDATGGRTFVWPTSFKGTMTIGSTASECNVQTFAYDSNATTYYAISAGVINQ